MASASVEEDKTRPRGQVAQSRTTDPDHRCLGKSVRLRTVWPPSLPVTKYSTEAIASAAAHCEAQFTASVFEYFSSWWTQSSCPRVGASMVGGPSCCTSWPMVAAWKSTVHAAG